MLHNTCRTIAFITIIISLFSCAAARMRRNLADPIVETRQTLQDFLAEHSFSSSNQFVMDATEDQKRWKVMDALMIGGMLIYDKQGRALCYQGDSHCDGVILKQLMEGRLDSFSVCNDAMPLDSTLMQLNVLQNGEKRTLRDFAGTDFFILEYWQKFKGKKLGYKTGCVWTEKQIAKQKKLRFTHIKVNADFLDEWGFTAGQTFPLNLKISKKGIETRLSDNPLQTSPASAQ